MANSRVVHDQVNLLRLVTRLEDDVANRQKWGSSGLSAWVKASNTAQNLGHARQLLKSLQNTNDNGSIASSSTSTLPDLARILDSLEPIVLEAQKSLAPQPRIRKSLLSDLPKPSPRPTLKQLSSASKDSSTTVDLTSSDPTVSAEAPNATDHLLLSPLEQNTAIRPQVSSSAPSSSISIPTAQPPAASSSENAPSGSTTATPTDQESTSRFLTTSMRTQEELSAQLAQMATQLKMNSLHFTEALARDRAVMEGAEEKLEGNLTRMQTERGRLKITGAKRGSTTWIILFAIFTVAVAWVVMFLIIRIT